MDRLKGGRSLPAPLLQIEVGLRVPGSPGLSSGALLRVLGAVLRVLGAVLHVLPLRRLLGGHAHSSSAAAVAWAGGDLRMATSWALVAAARGLSRLSQGHWKEFWGTWVWTQGYDHMFGDDGRSYSNLRASLRPLTYPKAIGTKQGSLCSGFCPRSRDVLCVASHIGAGGFFRTVVTPVR